MIGENCWTKFLLLKTKKNNKKNKKNKKWANALQSSNNHPYWWPVILLNKLFLSSPLLNANLERSFNEMNPIKIAFWSQLIIYSLSALLRIRISGLTRFTEIMPKNVWIVGATPRNGNSGKQLQGVRKTKVKDNK